MMNHDYCHCLDYDKKVCPKDCFRAQLAEDLKSRWDLHGIPMTYSHLKENKYYCPLAKGEEEREVAKND